MSAVFADLERVDQETIVANLIQAPAPWYENLLADLLVNLPSSPTHQDIVRVCTMTLAAAGIYTPGALGLDILTGSDTLPLIAGGGALAVAGSVA